jgi:hypothetical protein
VHPNVVLQRLGLGLTTATGRKGREKVVQGLAKLDTFPVSLGESFRKQCLQHRGALNAVIAARSCAMAVLTGEVDLPPEELAPEHADRVRREGWIYGLREPKAPSEETPPDA